MKDEKYEGRVAMPVLKMAGWITREKIKAENRAIMFDESLPLQDRVVAAENVLEALYWRSAEANHPLFCYYVAMILHQGKEGQPFLFPDDVRKQLEIKYGKMKGITSGTYWLNEKKRR